jgi:hypothetical protein
VLIIDGGVTKVDVVLLLSFGVDGVFCFLGQFFFVLTINILVLFILSF